MVSNHINETVPRYNKGAYSKRKPTSSKAQRLTLQSLTQLPSSFISNPLFHIDSTATLPNTPVIRLSLKQTLSSLLPHQSLRLSPDCSVVNCGGMVMSCVLSMDESDGVAVVSCGKNEDGIVMNQRSIPPSNPEAKEGFIRCYSLVTQQLVLQFTHSHHYAIQMKWLHHTTTSQSYGVLCCVFVDGVIELLNVLSLLSSHSQIPRMINAPSPLLLLQPIVRMAFPVRATTITQHILFDDIVIVGFEDGSARVMELNEASWDVLNVMKSACGWFESSPVRSVVCSSYNEEEVMVMNEVCEVKVNED